MIDYCRFSRNRRRLAEYDYRSAGRYFITICTKDRVHYFGEVRNGVMEPSDMGIIVRDLWPDIPIDFPHAQAGEMVVMPNHIHGVIIIEDHWPDEEATSPITKTPSCTNGPADKNEEMAALSPKAGSLSRIINAYKGTCTRMLNSICTETFAWQPRFHDRIIRDEREWSNVIEYIRQNPARWTEDELFR
jgi:putative transposase